VYSEARIHTASGYWTYSELRLPINNVTDEELDKYIQEIIYKLLVLKSCYTLLK
jgi:hypothetical protein